MWQIIFGIALQSIRQNGKKLFMWLINFGIALQSIRQNGKKLFMGLINFGNIEGRKEKGVEAKLGRIEHTQREKLLYLYFT